MKAGRERSHLITKDLSEQGESKYVLLVSGKDVIPPMLIGVDAIQTTAEHLRAYRQDILVLQFPAPIEYCLFHRSLVDVIDREQFIRWRLNDDKDTEVIKEECGWPSKPLGVVMAHADQDQSDEGGSRGYL